MLDRDLAELYGVETRTVNQAVKRNLERFPPSFMFQLNDLEYPDKTNRGRIFRLPSIIGYLSLHQRKNSA